MRYEYNIYRTKDSSLDVRFLFVEINPSEWRAYILTEINYKKHSRLRSELISITHRLTEFDNDRVSKIRYFISDNNIPYTKSAIQYICWTKKITTLSNIKELAKTWCEITAYYIKHGGTFETIHPILKADGTVSF